MCQGLSHFKDAASLSLCPNLHRDSERLKLQSRGSSSGSTQLTMERFAMVSSNPLVSTGYNIVIVPPGRSSLQFPGFPYGKTSREILQSKEQSKIYKQFVWAKEPAAHRGLAI